MINKILKYFRERKIQSIIYAAVLIITFAAVIVFFIWSLFFLVKLINSIVISPDEEPLAESTFDFIGLTGLSQKLKIILPEDASPEASPKAQPQSPLEISVQILNSTDVKGLAKLWEEKFKSSGFGKIETGNTDRKDGQGFEISYKPSKKESLDLIKSVLIAANIKASSIKEKEGIEEQINDFIITIGIVK